MFPVQGFPVNVHSAAVFVTVYATVGVCTHVLTHVWGVTAVRVVRPLDHIVILNRISNSVCLATIVLVVMKLGYHALLVNCALQAD